MSCPLASQVPASEWPPAPCAARPAACARWPGLWPAPWDPPRRRLAKPGENRVKTRGKPVENPDVLPGFTRFYQVLLKSGDIFWEVIDAMKQYEMDYCGVVQKFGIPFSKLLFLNGKNMMHCGSSGFPIISRQTQREKWQR